MQDVRTFWKFLREYDYVVTHCIACIGDFSRLSYLLPKSVIRKKLIWIEWGADLYSSTDSKLTDALRRRIKQNVHTFVAIFPPDLDTYRQKFPKSKARMLYAPYSGVIPAYYSDPEPGYRLENREAEKPLSILVGHNANKSLNHIAVLKELKKYADENIRIILPLSYNGTKAYADQVQTFAEETFPGKVTALRELMAKADYYRFLDNVDIAIFNTQRQIALGNIRKFIWQKAKVFISETCCMYGYFRENGITVQKYEDIGQMSFREFSAPQERYDPEKYRAYLDELMYVEAVQKRWEAVYKPLP